MKHKLVFAGLLIVLFYIIVTNINALWPIKVLEIFNEPLPILNENKQVERGEIVMFKIDFCKYGDHKATTRPMLVSDKDVVNIGTVVYEFMIPQRVISQAKEGCRSVNNELFIVPSFVRPGTYYLQLNVDYEINRLRTDRVIIKSEVFEVIK
jgi:hypothetical protein